jgi:transcriptional regulator with XRE-family HTH domain
MSITVNHQEDKFRGNRQSWGRLFGMFIQKGRENRGRSVEEAARLAGMEPSAWLAVEAGRVPETAAQLRSIAGALQLTDAQLGIVVSLCRDAWGI